MNIIECLKERVQDIICVQNNTMAIKQISKLT